MIHAMHSDQELIPRAAAGDGLAFAALVDRHYPLVFRLALAMCGDEDEAEDVAQETFVRVHRKLASYRGDGAFDGWLYRIARRVLFRARRREARRQSVVSLALESDDERDVYRTDPGARVDRGRAIALVGEVAATLPMRQREVFVLCDLEGRSPAEVALLTGAKNVTVRANLFKARAAIRRAMLSTHPAFTVSITESTELPP